MNIKDIRKGVKIRFSKYSIIRDLMLFIALFLSIIKTSSAQNCPIVDSAIITNVSCWHGSGGISEDGAIDLVLINPGGNYSFNWNTQAGDITEDINSQEATSELAIGFSHDVTITDNTNPTCFQFLSFTITQPQNPLSSTVNLWQNVLCHGDSSGVAFANVIGGTLPYSYQWDNIVTNSNGDTIYYGDTTAVAVGLWGDTTSSGGTGVSNAIYHTVTFTDANGCSTTDSIAIFNENPAIVGTITIIDSVSCFGACDGIAELATSGGVSPYDYDWDNGQQYNGLGPNTATALCYGGHDIIITDALSCRKIVSFTIFQPDELFTQAIGDGAPIPGIGPPTQPVQCYGLDNGTAFASATGGTTPYSFVWDSLNGPTGQHIDSLTPGIHTVYVTDKNGCTHYDTVVITEPTELVVTIVDSMTIYSYCAGTNSGRLCAIASGGTPGYNYLWNDVFHQTTPCATDLIAQYNDYIITVYDDRGCHTNASFQLDSITNSLHEDSVSLTIQSTKCFGESNGYIVINPVVGGVHPYTYSWTGPPGIFLPPSDSIPQLSAGVYAVIIEDYNGCAITVNAEVEQPVRLEYTTYNVFSETCYGACDGKISVNVQGGTGSYYYDDSQSGIFPITPISFANNWTELINDSSIINLCSDWHSIYITDDNKCEAAVAWGGSWQEQVGPGVVVPVPLVWKNSPSCFNTNDGHVLIQSPDPLFTYTWETLGGTVIDTGISTSILYTGSYNVVAHYSDSASFGQVYSGCDVTLPFTLNGPSPLLANETVTDVSCFGLNDGTILLAPTSPALGTPSVLWDTTTSVPGSSVDLSQNPLQPGTYTVTITDANGCIITNDIVVEEPDAITASISFTPPSCNGLSDGDATIISAGGTGTLNFNWTPSGGNNTTTSPISAGVYTANVSDVNGCQASFSIIVTEPEAIIASLEPNIFYNENQAGDPYHISCFGFSDGSAIVSNGGGVSPITYSWSTSGGTGIEETGISAGPVTVTVTDANNCSESQTITLIEPAYLEPNIDENIYSTSTNGITNEISCYGMSDGFVESLTFGGVETPNEPYQYLWTNDNTGQVVSTQAIAEGLPANFAYTITVTDANGCISQETTTIFDEPVPFIADVTTTNYGGPTHAPFTTNFVDNTISIDPFDFNWTWEDGTSYYPNNTLTFNHEFSIDNIGENNVFVIVTNLATSCFDSVPFIINAQGIPEINNVFTPNGDQYNNEFYFEEHSMINIDVQVFNRWGQLVYSWSGENKSWDGKGADGQDLPEAVYFYVLKAEGSDGHYYDKKGSVTLLR